jgi:hypothetical protein
LFVEQFLLATVVDTAANEQPHDAPRPRAAARWFLPGMMSTATHLAVIVALAMFVNWKPGAGSVDGPTTGMSLSAVMIDAPVEAEDGSAVETASYDTAVESKVTVEQPPAETAPPASSTPAEASLLDQQPKFELQDVLPASGGQLVSTTGRAPLVNPAPTPSAPSAHKAGEGARQRRTAGPPGLAEALGKGAARTGVFGLSGTGYKFVYVFDRSGSMDGHGGAPLAAAKYELIHSLHDLDKTHQFQIVFYNEHPRVFSILPDDTRLVFGTEQNKMLAERFVRGITADGATQHEEALSLALRLNPDVIFFLTDADEPILTGKQLARLSRLNNGTKVHTIEFGYGPAMSGENFLVRLARQNGGKHVYVDVAELMPKK